MRGSSRACSAIGDIERIAVLDAGAIFAGVQLRLPLSITTSVVMNEVKDEDSRANLERALEAGKLLVVDPGQEFIEEAIGVARLAGTLDKLSKADLGVIALALEMRGCKKEVAVASDDYAVQVTALRAGLEVIPVRYRGIREAKRHNPLGQSK
ncbi:MAG: hypothetical protein RXP86_02080 [Acidilobus sp.]|jgi:Predicted nucleic acid-binding protein, consists of a PIN domain and a Zn-ribbon module|nr:nucleotide-binding protein [Acidilobus sp.]